MQTDSQLSLTIYLKCSEPFESQNTEELLQQFHANTGLVLIKTRHVLQTTLSKKHEHHHDFNCNNMIIIKKKKTTALWKIIGKEIHFITSQFPNNLILEKNTYV